MPQGKTGSLPGIASWVDIYQHIQHTPRKYYKCDKRFVNQTSALLFRVHIRPCLHHTKALKQHAAPSTCKMHSAFKVRPRADHKPKGQNTLTTQNTRRAHATYDTQELVRYLKGKNHSPPWYSRDTHPNQVKSQTERWHRTSTMGAARGSTQGSWRPFPLIVVSSPPLVTVFWSCPIVDVGLKA